MTVVPSRGAASLQAASVDEVGAEQGTRVPHRVPPQIWRIGVTGALPSSLPVHRFQLGAAVTVLVMAVVTTAFALPAASRWP